MGNISNSLKKYFEEATQEEIEKDLEELKHLNNIGPDATEYVKYYKNKKDMAYLTKDTNGLVQLWRIINQNIIKR